MPIVASSLGLGWVSSWLRSFQPSRTPKSSTGRTSGRARAEMRTISTVQRPTPRMVTRREMRSASSRDSASRPVGTVPSMALAQMSRMAAILEAEKPQARRAPSLGGEDLVGWGEAFVGIQGVEAGEDGAGGVAVELLVGDGADEELVGLAAGFGRGGGADAGDEGAEGRVGRGEVVEGGLHGWRVLIH